MTIPYIISPQEKLIRAGEVKKFPILDIDRNQIFTIQSISIRPMTQQAEQDLVSWLSISKGGQEIQTGELFSNTSPPFDIPIRKEQIRENATSGLAYNALSSSSGNGTVGNFRIDLDNLDIKISSKSILIFNFRNQSSVWDHGVRYYLQGYFREEDCRCKA
jgi:hypothetical protein